MPDYALHGLRVRTSASLPGVAEEPFSGDPDCVIHFAPPPPALATGDDRWFRIRLDEAEATFDREGKEVWLRGDFAAATTHLLGQVIGFVLRLRGTVSLHAACVALGGRAVAIAGPSSAGKSTLAAAFAVRGDVVLSDNITALREEGGTFLALPGPYRFLLGDDAATAIFGDAARFPSIITTAEKRVIAPPPPPRSPLPLGAVFILDRSAEPLSEPVVAQFDRKEALIALLHNSYGSVFFTPAMRAADLELLARVALSVPVFDLLLPKDLAALPRAMEAISLYSGS